MRLQGGLKTGAVWALALATLVLASSSAQAAHGKAKAHAKARARAAARRLLRPNMPAGWQWPPTASMQQDGERCLRDLTRLEVTWKPGPVTRKIVTPVIVPDMRFGGVTLVPRWGDGPYVMDCRLARALARFVGPALANMHITELRFGQIYKYRNVAGPNQEKHILSRHALGLAMDVYAFVTSDGEAHVVQGGYKDGDEVLLEVERRVTDTGAFRTLLTPGNDPKHHYDHFHFEARAAGDKVVSPPTREPADARNPSNDSENDDAPSSVSNP